MKQKSTEDPKVGGFSCLEYETTACFVSKGMLAVNGPLIKASAKNEYARPPQPRCFAGGQASGLGALQSVCFEKIGRDATRGECARILASEWKCDIQQFGNLDAFVPRFGALLTDVISR